jgi:hypothetical protein
MVHTERILSDILITGPGDIEVHLGKDGRMYIVDTARLFCAETPNGRKGAAFYRLLRPEFVRTYKIPLSSDCFTGWGTCNKVIAVDCGDSIISLYSKRSLFG